jgi:hypothetical protein
MVTKVNRVVSHRTAAGDESKPRLIRPSSSFAVQDVSVRELAREAGPDVGRGGGGRLGRRRRRGERRDAAVVRGGGPEPGAARVPGVRGVVARRARHQLPQRAADGHVPGAGGALHEEVGVLQRGAGGRVHAPLVPRPRHRGAGAAGLPRRPARALGPQRAAGGVRHRAAPDVLVLVPQRRLRGRRRRPRRRRAGPQRRHAPVLLGGRLHRLPVGLGQGPAGARRGPVRGPRAVQRHADPVPVPGQPAAGEAAADHHVGHPAADAPRVRPAAVGHLLPVVPAAVPAVQAVDAAAGAEPVPAGVPRHRAHRLLRPLQERAAAQVRGGAHLRPALRVDRDVGHDDPDPVPGHHPLPPQPAQVPAEPAGAAARGAGGAPGRGGAAGRRRGAAAVRLRRAGRPGGGGPGPGVGAAGGPGGGAVGTLRPGPGQRGRVPGAAAAGGDAAGARRRGAGGLRGHAALRHLQLLQGHLGDHEQHLRAQPHVGGGAAERLRHVADQDALERPLLPGTSPAASFFFFFFFSLSPRAANIYTYIHIYIYITSAHV